MNNDLSLYLRDANDHDGAIKAINNAIRLREDEPRFYINRGEVYRRLQQPQQVLGDFGRAMMLDSEDPVAFYRLASFWLIHQNLHLAEPNLRQAMELKANHHDAMFWLAYTLTHKGSLEEAKTCVSLAIS